MQGPYSLAVALPEILALIGLVIFVGAFIRADLRAQPVLAQARSELFGNQCPMRYHSIYRGSWIYRYRNNPRLGDYQRIHRREAIKGLEQVAKAAGIWGVFILLSLLAREAAGTADQASLSATFMSFTR